MGQMLQDLDLALGQRVLEIGAGTGYNAALLAHVVGPGLVTSIDVDRDVLSRAWDSLRRFSERQIRLEHADGRRGYPPAAPFERIIVTAASPDLEPAWLEQLTPGGKLLVPLVIAPGLEFVVVGSVTSGCFTGRLTRAAYFMPLRDEQDVGPQAQASCLPPPERLNALAAPWASWFERPKLRAGWAGFSQSLALFMHLQGAAIQHCSLDDGSFLYGVSGPDPTRGAWLGKEVWHVSDDATAKIVFALYRKFLDRAAPCPIDYELTIAPALAGEGDEDVFLRLGPRLAQRWQVRERRTRTGWL
jgi:protein-L-isoaspartate O-methyltransferase